MDALTHLFVGRLLAAGLAGSEHAVALGWIATVFAVLPDADTVTWAVKPLRRYVRHRGITHTLPFGIGASLLAGALAATFSWAPFWAAATVAFVGFLTHVGLDVLNWGAPVLWPWRKTTVEWTIHGGFLWSALFSASSVVVLTLLTSFAPHAVGWTAAAMAAGFVGYLALRATSKLVQQRRHPGQWILPTANPFRWRVYGPRESA